MARTSKKEETLSVHTLIPSGARVCKKRHKNKEIHAFFHPADASCHLHFYCNDRFYGKRSDTFPPCARVPSHPGRAFFCQESAYAFSVLGVCIALAPSRIPLEHDHGDDKEALEKGVCRPCMDIAGICFPDSCLWGVRFLEKRGLGIYVP